MKRGLKKIAIVNMAILFLLACCMTTYASEKFTWKSFIVDEESGGDVRLVIYRNHPEDSTPFQVKNMFPGDVEIKNYYVAVSYRGSIVVHFHADIKPGYEKLAEVLNCKVVLQNTGEELYDGLMREMPASLDHTLRSSGKTMDELEYEITVYLDTSVGNEYMNKELVADFRWWAAAKEIHDDDDQQGAGTGNSKEPEQVEDKEVDQETENQEGEIAPGELVVLPKTGDSTRILPFLIMLFGSIAGMLILLLLKRREEKENEM